MSTLPPILPQLLGDTATVRAEDETSTYEHELLEPETWERVRLDTDAQAVDAEWAHDSQLSAVLYVDAVLSSPARPPELRSHVTVTRNGRTYKGIVRDVRELCDDYGQVHHWEVGLQ